ncbi:unnamed protein product, partial [Ectocarpus sp. 4 AP-2014]
WRVATTEVVRPPVIPRREAEVASLNAEMGSLSEQISQLTMLVTILASRKMEDSGGAKEGAARRGNATESVAASPAVAHGGAPQVESARAD